MYFRIKMSVQHPKESSKVQLSYRVFSEVLCLQVITSRLTCVRVVHTIHKLESQEPRWSQAPPCPPEERFKTKKQACQNQSSLDTGGGIRLSKDSPCADSGSDFKCT